MHTPSEISKGCVHNHTIGMQNFCENTALQWPEFNLEMRKNATEYTVADNTNIEKGEAHMLGYDFLQASSEEKLITVLVLLGVLAVVGIATLVSKRRKKI